MGHNADQGQIDWAKKAARFYRRRGWNPLPSRSDAKKPNLLTYKECYTALLDDTRYRAWNSGNVQVVTGAQWSLGVVDLDGGTEAAEAFGAIANQHADANGWAFPLGAPWVVKTGSGTGVHLWFTLPEGLMSLPSRAVWGEWDYLGGPEWKGAWTKGLNIEIIGDNKLIVAPPSIHPRTGKPYTWSLEYGPKTLPFPGIMPDWIINLPERKPPSDAFPAQELVPLVERKSSPAGGEEYDREDVLAAIGNKVAVAMSWRVEFTRDLPNDAGWIECRAVSQASPGSRSGDENPSGRFHPQTGVYMEMYDRKPVSLFDLGVMTGYYKSWRACMNDLGRLHGAVPYRLSGRCQPGPSHRPHAYARPHV